MKITFNNIGLLLIVLILVSCSKKSQTETDDEIIRNYISINSLDAQKTTSGLYYIIQEEGTGKYPTINAHVKVSYKGSLVDSTVFDSTGTSESRWFYLTSVIEGWKEGIPKFKKGGKGILLIPSRLGYGSKPQNNIPANSVLIFDIHLIDFEEIVK